MPCQACPDPKKSILEPNLGLRVSTNVASVVSAYEGEWEQDNGFLLIGNFLQPEVTLFRGDVVGAARAISINDPPLEVGEPWPICQVGPSAEDASVPDVAHVWRDQDEVQRL